MRRDPAVEALVAAGALAATLLLLAADGLGAADPGSRPLDALGVLLAAGSTAPLAARLRAPATVLAVVSAATAALLALGYPLDLALGAAVAVHAVGLVHGGHPDRRRRWAAAAAAPACMAVIVGARAATGSDVLGVAPELATWFLLLVAVWIAGDRTRLRRERLAALQERVARAKHDSERERRLVAAEERTRIARELHDSAGHAVNVILVQAGAARLLADRDPEASRRAIGTVEQVARDTLGEIDRIVHALRDQREDAGAVFPTEPGALEQVVERHRAMGIRIATRIRGGRRALPHSVAWAAHRILQEALTNAARHGDGDADVDIAFGADAVEILVRNPAGSAAPAGRTGGHGLVGMRERAMLLGGTLEAGVDRAVFRLRATLPYGGTLG